ncbi:MAG: hypothetical protein LBN18_02830 [Dysgonamonadaceae bacterium]|jgi:hypothetical protein|nr:hypothetical protein [Dysgonamonadaceae bacterium]
MLKPLKRVIWDYFGINKAQLTTLTRSNEILKAITFNSTIADCEWLKYRNFSPGRHAVDYAFLYTLFRVLEGMKPKSVIEFGLGESSKLIQQYAYFHHVEAVTVEHDPDWIRFFSNNTAGKYPVEIKLMELAKIKYKNKETLSYKNIEEELKGKQYDLIVIDGPFGSKRYSRPQILFMAKNNLQKEFCILVDDYVRKGERETVKELLHILNQEGIKYVTKAYAGSKQHFLICSENLKFLTTL